MTFAVRLPAKSRALEKLSSGSGDDLRGVGLLCNAGGDAA
jgi:hypothetical protein